METLHPSLVQVLHRRGYKTKDHIDQLLNPSLDLPSFSVPQMDKAVNRLRDAIRTEEPIVIYADRDVDGLSGLAILARSLRTLGGHVTWGSPLQGRGLERSVLETLAKTGAKVMILVDCGTGETTELTWLASQGMDVIVADHHRMLPVRPPAFAWIHPGAVVSPQPSPDGRGRPGPGEAGTPCGSVMAFKLAEGLWRSFIGSSDPERLHYFLYDHLDLVALGILADRVPVTGENRALVWHGMRRLAKTRKEGLASLLRFFRIKGNSVTVRQATWQIIPLLNAAGRLGKPHWAAKLLITEDPWTARECIDALLGLNTERRRAQGISVDHFEKTVLEQCAMDTDGVLVATARDLEPSVTGLAAQSLVKKYGRPAFLFVEQGEDLVGSGRGTPDVDLFAWTLQHQDLLIKFGGHHGAVGLTVRKSDFPALREGLLKSAEERDPSVPCQAVEPEAEMPLDEATSEWWENLQTLEPFGPGFEIPTFELSHVESVTLRSKRNTTKVMLKSGAFQWPGEFLNPSSVLRHLPPEGGRSTAISPRPLGRGPGDARGEGHSIVASPVATPKEDFPFKWMIHEE